MSDAEDLDEFLKEQAAKEKEEAKQSGDPNGGLNFDDDGKYQLSITIYTVDTTVNTEAKKKVRRPPMRKAMTKEMDQI